MITVTLIRHGESEDNLRPIQIWAGWKDAPLSALGKEQANALGESLSSTPITHLYGSPLLRAYSTAEYVRQYRPDPKPPIKTNPHLREQYYGIAEGHPWMVQPPNSDTPFEELFKENIFPVLHDRDAKFPEAESLNDLARRADKGIRECVLLHLHEAQTQEGEHGGVHVAIASHGRCIGELLSALMRLDPEAERDVKFTKLANTAWTRVEIRIRDDCHGDVDPANPPPLQLTVTNVNERNHLESLKNIPHLEFNGGSTDARAYFGGENIEI